MNQMSAFNCPMCSKETRVLVYGDKDRGCPDCVTIKDRGFALGHSTYAMTNAGKITHADAMRIKTNRLRSDGEYKPDRRWRSSRPDLGD